MRCLIVVLCLFVATMVCGCGGEKYYGSERWKMNARSCESGRALRFNDCVAQYRYDQEIVASGHWSCQVAKLKPMGTTCKPTYPGFEDHGICNANGECLAAPIVCDDDNPCTADWYVLVPTDPYFNEYFQEIRYIRERSECRHSNVADGEYCLIGGECWAGKCVKEMPNGTLVWLHPIRVQTPAPDWSRLLYEGGGG